jgi:hypothetical protein
MELVGSPNRVIEPQVKFWDSAEYRLVGMVYFGGFHFVARTITPDNRVYVHDGMNGPYSTYEGTLGEDFGDKELAFCGERIPSLAIYASN